MIKVITGLIMTGFISIFADNLSSDGTCNRVLSKYSICREIRSVKGWKRVFNNNKIHLYTDKIIRLYDFKLVKKCLTSEKTVRREEL